MDEPGIDRSNPLAKEALPAGDLQDTVDVAATSEPLASNSHGTSPSPSPTLRSWTDTALHFLAHASNETLGACLVGLGATTYFVLGRVGLLVIGVAGGVVLHATWDGVRGCDEEETQRRERERRTQIGIDVAKRVLEWRSTRSAQETDTPAAAPDPMSSDIDFSRFEPETARALDTFADAMIKDYVFYWYAPTLPGEQTFPASCRRTFTAFVLSLSAHLQRKRPADTFLDFVTNASSMIIVLLNELAAATNACPHSDAQAAIETYLRMKPDTSLSYLLDEDAQTRKLEAVAEDVMRAYLDPHSLHCPPVHALLKQVLANLVLGSTVTLCSRPEWINEWIVYGLEESETTKNVMDMVDAGVEGRSASYAVETVSQPVEKLPQPVEKMREPGSEKRLTDHPHHLNRRESTKAEETMDEAMREAKRLTQMMIEEDERRAREERGKQTATSSWDDLSELATHGAPTPTSSQSDRDRQDQETSTWGTDSPTAADSRTGSLEAVAMSGSKQPFTSFDQLPPAPTDVVETPKCDSPQLTLQHANISVFDDSVPGERASIKAKPTIDYMIQIEPSSSAFRGWMIARKYADFETLHEVLRRISVITGEIEFAEAHAELPKWRGNTKATLRSELERYVTDAVRYQSLAESEGMKRFLEKDRGLERLASGSNKAFGWPTPDAFGKLGGDMMNVLTKAPKQVAGGVAGGGKAVLGGVAGGGKAVFGGVAGLVGSVGGKKLTGTQSGTSSPMRDTQHPPQTPSFSSSLSAPRASQESLQVSGLALGDRHVEREGGGDAAARSFTSHSDASFEASRVDAASLAASTGPRSPMQEAIVNLPPRPSEMPDDPVVLQKSTPSSIDMSHLPASPPSTPTRPPTATPAADNSSKDSLSEAETSVAVELIFAVITELYTLSSAWNIRRTLLAAAKTYLLRPGNPQLLSIRDLLQTSLFDANLSDAGLASHVTALRANCLPNEAELAAWRRDFPPKPPAELDALRLRARALLVTKGMPQALTSVMGAAASGEALGKVFDCLQVPAVSRGLVFGLTLQALRVVTH